MIHIVPATFIPQAQIKEPANLAIDLHSRHKQTSINKKLQKAWAVGMGIGFAWASYGLFTWDNRSVLGGLGLFGSQALGYVGYFDGKTSQQALLQKKEDKSNFHKFIELTKDDPIYALAALVSLRAVAYGLTDGFITGNFTQAKIGTGMLGVFSLLKGNYEKDNQNSQTYIKLGSVASVIFFFCCSGKL